MSSCIIIEKYCYKYVLIRWNVCQFVQQFRNNLENQYTDIIYKEKALLIAQTFFKRASNLNKSRKKIP